MVEWITDIMESLGYMGIAFLMFLENLFPPIPSEVIMPLAGFTVAKDIWHLFRRSPLGFSVRYWEHCPGTLPEPISAKHD